MLTAGIDDRLQPSPLIGRGAIEEPEKRALNLLGHRSALSRSNGNFVNRTNRCHFGRRARQKDFIRDVQHLSRDVLLDDIQAERRGEFDHRIASDARQNRCRSGRRINYIVPDQKQVLACSFADEPLRIERNAFGEPEPARFQGYQNA